MARRRNKVLFLCRLRLGGAPLRHRRRARGGRASFVRSVYRSPASELLRLRRRRGEVCSSLFIQGCRGNWGVQVGGRADPARRPCGDLGCRRRAQIRAGWSLGRCPGRRCVQLLLIPSSGFGCLLRLKLKPACDGAPSGLGLKETAGSAGGGGVSLRRRWNRPHEASGPGTCLDFQFFLGACSLFVWDNCSLYLCTVYLYVYSYVLLNL